LGTIWYLLFNPNKRILLVREEGKNARKVLEAIRIHYRSDKMKALYKLIWDIDNFTLVKDTDTKVVLPTKTTNTPEGNIEVTGLDWSLTGGHYDHIHCDDIITLKDRVSQAKRDQTDRFVYELQNIKDPDGIVTFSGTPWHKMDTWRLLPKPLTYSIYDLKLKEYTDEIIKQKRSIMPPSLFAANYELKHISDENALFANPQWGLYDKNHDCVGQIDAGYKGDNTTVLTFMYTQDEDIHAVGYCWNDNIENVYDSIVGLCIAYKCGSVHMEDNADKGLAATQLRNKGLHIVDYHEQENKHIKILGYLYRHYSDIKWSHDTDTNYMAQVVDYQEKQEPDDAPDSAASLLRAMGFGGVPIVEQDYSFTELEHLYEPTTREDYR
jgi:hypothetical protein